MALIRNLAGQLVDEDTFVCSECTFLHPVSDLGAFKFRMLNQRSHSGLICAHCVQSVQVSEGVRMIDAGDVQNVATVFEGLKKGETIYLVRRPN